MKLNVGDLVTRISHNHDTIFRIIDIKDDMFCLKGINIRLYADSDEHDLVLYKEGEDIEKEEPFLERLNKNNSLDRNEYFYIPGKILHIDSDISLSNNLLNHYKIREKAKIQKYINHQKN